MDEVIGSRLVRVTRLSWQAPASSPSLASGPTHLAFDDGRNVLIDCRSDWSLEWAEASPGDGWRQPFDYEYNGGSWDARDASTENPFDAVVGQALTGWVPQLNEFGEPVGVALHFGDVVVTLRSWEGEVQAVPRA